MTGAAVTEAAARRTVEKIILNNILVGDIRQSEIYERFADPDY